MHKKGKGREAVLSPECLRLCASLKLLVAHVLGLRLEDTPAASQGDESTMTFSSKKVSPFERSACWGGLGWEAVNLSLLQMGSLVASLTTFVCIYVGRAAMRPKTRAPPHRR